MRPVHLFRYFGETSLNARPAMHRRTGLIVRPNLDAVKGRPEGAIFKSAGAGWPSPTDSLPCARNPIPPLSLSRFFRLVQALFEVIVQVRIVQKSADGLLAEQRGFVESAIPVLGCEIALTDAH
jgi:hypothetical protein